MASTSDAVPELSPRKAEEKAKIAIEECETLSEFRAIRNAVRSLGEQMDARKKTVKEMIEKDNFALTDTFSEIMAETEMLNQKVAKYNKKFVARMEKTGQKTTSKRRDPEKIFDEIIGRWRVVRDHRNLILREEVPQIITYSKARGSTAVNERRFLDHRFIDHEGAFLKEEDLVGNQVETEEKKNPNVINRDNIDFGLPMRHIFYTRSITRGQLTITKRTRLAGGKKVAGIDDTTTVYERFAYV